MRDFKDSIQSFYEELLAFIHKFEILDDKEPFTNSIFHEIRSLIEEIYTSAIFATDNLSKKENNLKSEFNKLVDEYEREINKNQKNLSQYNKEIKDRYEQIINDFNQEINENKKQNLIDEKNTALDIELYITSSEQYIDMFESEYKDNTNRFSYQYSVAKDSYNENIIHYNDILEAELSKLDKTYSGSLNTFDLDTERIISAYNTSIEKDSILLEEKTNNFKQIMDEIRESRRNETMILNDSIRELANTKNQMIGNARSNYSTAQNNSIIEKENKRQEYHLENQKISREFVYNMAELDDIMNIAKNEYNRTINDKQETQFTACHALHKQQEKRLMELYKGNESDRDTKLIAKDINKSFYILKRDEIKRTQKEIRKITKEFLIENEKNSYNKKLLDLDRTSAIKRLTEQEIRDNKYYQEINNQHENRMNYEIQTANSKYTVDANNVRLNSSIKNLNFEKRVDELVAAHEKEIEAITNRIKKTKLEIDVALAINKLTHEYEENIYQRRNNYLTVTNLLEIEKCKVLDVYNKRQYDLNVDNYKIILDYSKKKIQIQNEKYEVLEKQKIKINKKKLENLINSTGFRIMEHSINERAEYDYADRKNKHLSNTLSHNILYERFKRELKNFHFSLSTLVLLIRDIEDITARIIDCIFDNITFRPEHYDLVKTFVNEFIKITSSYYINIIRDFKEIQHQYIKERLDFENDFKYKETYKQLKSKYDSNLTALNIEKTSVYAAIDDCKNQLEDNRTQIFRLESSITYKKQQKNSLVRQEISDNRKAIHSLFKEIKGIDKEILQHEKSIESIDRRLADVEEKYSNDLNDIKQIQYKSSLSYHTLRDKITQITDYIVDELSSRVKEINTSEIDFTSYSEMIEQNRQIFNKDNTENLNQLYSIMNIFSSNTSNNLDDALESINLSNEKETNNLKRNYQLKLDKCKMNYNKSNNRLLYELRKLEKEYDTLSRYYNREEKKNEMQYQANIKQILLDKKESTNQFYIELYAVNDNAKDIENDYHTFLREYSKDFENKKIELISNSIQRKKDLDTSLDDYIRTRNDLISHLPTAVKLQTKSLVLETKQKNKDVDIELSNFKSQFNVKRKQIKKNLSIIESTFNSSIDKIDSEQKTAINKEKRLHNSQLTKIK